MRCDPTSTTALISLLSRWWLPVWPPSLLDKVMHNCSLPSGAAARVCLPSPLITTEDAAFAVFLCFCFLLGLVAELLRAHLALVG